MKVYYNTKQVANADRRFNDRIVCIGKDPRLARKRLTKRSEKNWKVLFALALVPMTALFLTGCVETKQKMDSKPEQVQEVEDLPPSTKLEELSVVNPITEHAEAKESIEDMIKRIFPEDWQLATAIFKAESGLNPNAKGDTNTRYPSIGVAQIRMLPERGLNEQDLYDPEYNLNYARMLFEKSGYKPWSTYNSGAYKQYFDNLEK